MSNRSYTGSHFGTFEIIKSDGKSVELAASDFEVEPTPIMQSFAESLSSPLRIKKPAVRKGFLEKGIASKSARGDEPFVEVSWDVALDLASDNLQKIYDKFGAEAVFGGSYGWASAGRFHHAQSQIHRFLNKLGGYTASINTYSHAAAEVLLPHIIGTEDEIIYNGTTWPVIRDHTKLIVAFGGLPSVTGQISPGGVSSHTNRSWVEECAKAGVRLVTIAPAKSQYDASFDSEWIAPHPNTDTALMLGIAWQIWENGQCDMDFIKRYCVGFDEFLSYLTGDSDGQAKTPQWASEICAVDAERIIRLADEITSQRCLLTSTWALQRADKGEQPIWMLIVLAAMVGQIGLEGGGFSLGLSSFNGVANPVKRRRYASLPQGVNPIKQRIPVARITELLESPGKQIDYNGNTITFPDIKAIYWAGGNPYHHHQDLARLQKAWRNPDVVIVNELEWNAMARRADIVFPVAGVMERNDVMASNSDKRLVALKKCAKPVGQSKTDYEIFCELAKRLGIYEQFSEGRNENEWLHEIHKRGQERFKQQDGNLPEFDKFWKDGFFQHCKHEEHRVGLVAFRENPDENPLITPSGKIEIYSKTIAGFKYEDCRGHPMWMPPKQYLSSKLTERYPLHLMSPQPNLRLHGQFDGNGASAQSKIKGREPAYLNQQEADKRGIKEDDIIRLYNDIGATLCGTKIVDWVGDNIIVLPTGAWYSPLKDNPSFCVHGNPNVLTYDEGTSRLSQGPSPNSILVEVELYRGELHPVEAHLPPELIKSYSEE